MNNKQLQEQRGNLISFIVEQIQNIQFNYLFFMPNRSKRNGKERMASRFIYSVFRMIKKMFA